MYYLGIDVGSSSVKLALVSMDTGAQKAVVQQPKEEMGMHAAQKGWAEQEPLEWWECVRKGIAELISQEDVDPAMIKGIGIAYQMHGLVVVDASGTPLRPSIIWCDSRAVEIGNAAQKAIGAARCDASLLNAPGNFTASKLKWVQQNEPDLYQKIHKFMLPGDFIAHQLSDEMNTTVSGLSEGVFWDFKKERISEDILNEYGFSEDLFPEVVPTFSQQCKVSEKGAAATGLAVGTPILYRAGDQPNNALSLNVFEPGEVASTGGTSGVIYAVTNTLSVKESSRVNNFAHVNHGKKDAPRIGKLMCVNGAGILYRWLLNNLDVASYQEMNQLAGSVPIGAAGLTVIPFGNGAERMLLNRDVGTRMVHLDLNRHTKAHLCRAALEGIAFSFVYGMEIMKSDGIMPKVIRAGNDNLYRSEIFSHTVATLLQEPIEIYDTTGAVGAARACAITQKGFDAFGAYLENDHIMTHRPQANLAEYNKAYLRWKQELNLILNN
ncbi:xylulokinase [Maribacter sp. 2307ULW6-5]|uniref:xylulokinase n=1 Tax=Maribacter sp. 2307ULW6-5 TaxID=3386275 RepID=UPI0039BD8538